MPVASCAGSSLPAMRRVVDGRAIVLGALGCYFGALAIVGPDTFWRRVGVPHLSPAFLDMHTITSGWECTRRGLAVVPVNPCDPRGRPMNYPRLWMAPAFLGIDQGASFALGVAAVVLFLACALLVAGRLHPVEGTVYTAALCSPAVMLGVERGNVDLVVFVLLALALLVFRRSPAGRAVGHGLLLFAAMLKLFPAFGWGPMLRQRPRFAIVGLAGAALIFAVYVGVTLDDIREIRRVSPRSDGYSYGLGPLADLDRPGWAPRSAFEAAAVGAGIAAAAFVAWTRRRLVTAGDVRAADAFCVGAGVYCGSYLFFYNFDYRLIFVLLTLPLLLRRGRVPFPWLGVLLVLAVLWLGSSLPPLHASQRYDELVNWVLFVYLGAGLLLQLLPRNAVHSRGPW
jgi:hypothetical protein